MGPWPAYSDGWLDPEADAAIAALQELVGVIRGLRAEYGVAQSASVAVQLADPSEALEMALAEEAGSVFALAGLSSIDPLVADAGVAGVHTVLKTGGEVFLPLAGVIDLDKERARIQAEVARTADLLARTQGKLENTGFLANAPGDVVERERGKLSSLTEQRERLEDKLRSLGAAV